MSPILSPILNPFTQLNAAVAITVLALMIAVFEVYWIKANWPTRRSKPRAG